MKLLRVGVHRPQHRVREEINAQRGILCAFYDQVSLVMHPSVLINLDFKQKQLTIKNIHKQQKCTTKSCFGSFSSESDSKNIKPGKPGKKGSTISINLDQLRGFLIGSISYRFQKIQ